MQAKIERWLERLPEHTTSIVLRAGDDRRTETIIERWTPDDLQSIIDETMDLMQDEIQGRLIAYGEKGKQLRSVTIRTEYKPDNLSETEALVDGLLKMADEYGVKEESQKERDIIIPEHWHKIFISMQSLIVQGAFYWLQRSKYKQRQEDVLKALLIANPIDKLYCLEEWLQGTLTIEQII